MSGKKVREVFLARLFEDGEIAAIDHMYAELERPAHQLAKMRIQLGGAAGNVQGPDARNRNECEHVADRFAGHELGARGARVHVAVQAALVALVAEVDLQRLQAAPAQRGKPELLDQRQCRVHSGFSW